MEKIIHICDKCGHEEIYSKSGDSKYRKVKFLIGQKGSSYVSDEKYSYGVATKVEMFLCPECQLKLGIHGKADNVEPNAYQQPELKDKVFELFEMIADELGYVKSE